MPDSNAETLRILPGQWRPHYPYEQIAWVSPPWQSPDHLWLDFPEAVFVSGELIYLGHVNELIPCRYQELPKVPWEPVTGGIGFHRELPNGLHFAGRLTGVSNTAIAMELSFANHGEENLTNIHLQTCAYLRAIREFADFTHENIRVHVASRRWVTLADAMKNPRDDGCVRLGWRSGPFTADKPMIACTSTTHPRGVVMTWFEQTFSLIGNPAHPCFHADPFVSDLAPGEADTLRGALVFFEGGLDDLDYERDIAPYGQEETK